MRKERALQRHGTSTSAIFNSLPKGVSKRLLQFGLQRMFTVHTWVGKTRRRKGEFDGERFYADGEVVINGVKYCFTGCSVNKAWQSISLYFTARNRKIRISDHWCKPDGQNNWNRGTAHGSKNLSRCRSIGYSYAGLQGRDESFVLEDDAHEFRGEGWDSWTIGSRVFEGGWVPLRNINVF